MCFVYTDDDKPNVTMRKQNDATVTKPQNNRIDMEELENVLLLLNIN